MTEVLDGIPPSWAVNTGRDWKPGGTRIDAQKIPATEPAPTVAGVGSQWRWQDGDDLVRGVTVSEAAILQSFPSDYPFAGPSAARWKQVGNAIPPTLAGHLLGALIR